MSVRRSVVIDNNAPVWAQRLETDLNAVLGSLSADLEAAQAGLSLTIIPVGAIVDYTGTVLPTNFLWPDGSAISRTTYALLFAAIGTAYGIGDGTTTFNLPDLRGRTAITKDDLGGTSANRVTNAGSGITGTALGATGGAQNVTLSTANVPTNVTSTYNLTVGATPVILVGSESHAASATNATVTMPPGIVLNKLIYAGA